MQIEEIFTQGLAETDITLSEDRIRQFSAFLTELTKWNRTYNLTAIRNEKEIVIKHFIDSLLYTQAIPKGIITLADAGTGAGFPGIPLKILRPEIELTLIESSRKKASFLRHVVRVLNLESTVVLERRLEQLGDEYEKAFDILVSRAAFSIKDFVDMSHRYIKKEGKLVISKGPMFREEIDELQDAPSPGCSVTDILSYQLPLLKADRNLVVIACSDSEQ